MTLGETEQFSTLVGKIYDATLDPALWISALEKIVGYVGGDAGVLTSRGVSQRVEAQLPPDILGLYVFLPIPRAGAAE